MSKESQENKILAIDPNVISQINFGNLQVQVIQLQTQVALLRNLIGQIDPDHDYKYDSNKGIFEKISKAEG